MGSFLFPNHTKKFFVVFLVSTVFLLTGCWDRKEVNDTAIVLGAAIDKEKGKNIRLTVQILIPRAVSGGQQSSGGVGGGGGAQVLVRSAIGENIADAASKIQTKFPRKIFWGHCKTYIIGEKLAKEGVREQIDFLIRHPEPRERADLFVSVGKAANLLELHPPLELYVGEALRKLADLRVGARITVKDYVEMLTGDTETAILPLVKKLSPLAGDEQETIANIIGTAIFKNDRMIGQIDTKVSRGLLWLRNDIEVSSVTVTAKKGEKISIDPIRQKTKLIPSIKNGKWKIVAKVKSEGTIVQNGSSLDIMSPSISKRVEKIFEKDIEQRMNLSLKQVKKEMNMDAFGFGDAFHRKYPKEWERVKDHWDKILPHVEVKIAIRTKISRPGLTTTPAGVQENEVQKK